MKEGKEGRKKRKKEGKRKKERKKEREEGKKDGKRKGERKEERQKERKKSRKTVIKWWPPREKFLSITGSKKSGADLSWVGNGEDADRSLPPTSSAICLSAPLSPMVIRSKRFICGGLKAVWSLNGLSYSRFGVTMGMSSDLAMMSPCMGTTRVQIIFHGVFVLSSCSSPFTMK